jgi:hypothetical protein
MKEKMRSITREAIPIPLNVSAAPGKRKMHITDTQKNINANTKGVI